MTELIQVFTTGGSFLLSVLALLKSLVVNYGILASWVVFWLFLVRWPDLRAQLRQGAWAGFVLLYFLISLVWGLTSDPYWSYFGLTLPSVLEKSILTLVLFLIAFLCGRLQDIWQWTPPEIEIPGPPDGVPAAAGHGHGGHGHDDHGHGHGDDSHHH